MRSKAESVRPIVTAAGLALALLAASPATKTSGLIGVSQAADTPPAVAQPEGVASSTTPADSTSVPAGAPAEDLAYHRESYLYASGSLRDPFASLVSGTFIAQNSNRMPDIGSIELVGVMWGEADRFAMLEDREGQGYVLRVGDPVVNGTVSGITRDSITISQYFFGTSTTVTLKLKPREGSADAKNKRR
jgi:hypothetical protein